jgi:SAM-dependent methyltransferase
MGATYERSARIYDLLYTGAGIKDYVAEAAGLHRIITGANPNARTLLDVACGTGQHLAQLKRWYAVEGVDASPAMLAVAAQRLPGVPLHRADMRTFDLGRPFDAVTCLFSSIGYLTEPSEMEQAIARLAAHVAPGGVLILDGWIRPEDWVGDYRGDPDIARDDSMTVVRLSVSRREGSIAVLDMHHLVRDASKIDYFVEQHRLALVPTSQYVAAFERVGLRPEVIRDYMPHRDRVVGKAR